MKKNDIIVCKITGIQPYGVFVSYKDYVGLIHISEISDQYVSQIEDILSVGDEVEAAIIDIDKAEKKIKLSYKKANPIHPRIQKMVKITIGFQSLYKALPFWIEKTKK